MMMETLHFLILIQRMRENLNDDEYAEATFTLELQRIKTEILFI